MSVPARLDARAIIKAVGIAVATGLVMGFVMALVLVVLIFVLFAMGYRYESSPVVRWLAFSIGKLPSILGGYLAAVFSGRSEILHGVVAGAALLVLHSYWHLLTLHFVPGYPFHPLMAYTSLGMTVPLAAAGAIFVKLMRKNPSGQ